MLLVRDVGPSCCWSEMLVRVVVGPRCCWSELLLVRDVVGPRCCWSEMLLVRDVVGPRCYLWNISCISCILVTQFSADR